MCDQKATRFFRPWNATAGQHAEESNESSDMMKKETQSYMKTEEDEDSILSSATCTADEGSAASFSENETLEMSDLNVDLATNQSRRRRRRRSETESRSSSVRSEASDKSNNLDVLRNFVLERGATCVQQTATRTDQLNKASGRASEVAYAFDKSAFEPVRPEYFQAGLHLGHFAGGQDAASCFLPTADSFAGNMAQMYYGFPVQGQFAQGLYGSVEEAVELIHRQDVAAKQLKKLRPKKFRCEHCDVAFSNNGQLKGHVRIHTGERPFKCDAENCGKSFTRNEELTRHKRIHTGLRPHSCVLCGKRFGRKDHLKKHTRTHDTRDPYRVSAALGVFALGHPLQRTHPLPPYVYPI